jgi:hypothetical protein
MSDSNLEELLKSPYSNRDAEDGVETPWKIPVAAAVIGALVTAIFIVLSIVNAPEDDLSATDSTPTTEASPPVVATGFPEGYAAVSDDVAMRVDVMTTAQDSTTLVVSSSVVGGAEPESAGTVDVAMWAISSNGSEASMVYQHTARTAIGGVTVGLSQVFDPQNAVVTATLPGAVVDVTDVLTLSPDVPSVVSDHRIRIDDSTVVVIDELGIGNGYGSIQWHIEGGFGARVDVAVAFDGVEFPLALYSPTSRSLDFDSGEQHMALPWNLVGETTLVRVGEPLITSSAPTGITVTFDVSAVTEAGDEIEIPIAATAQD